MRTLKINQRLLNGTLEKYFFNAKENNSETGKQLTLKTNTKMADVNPNRKAFIWYFYKFTRSREMHNPYVDKLI